MNTYLQSKQVLTDDSLMPTGKYAGTKMANVPASYFEHYEKNVIPTMANKPIFEYIRTHKDAILLELKK